MGAGQQGAGTQRGGHSREKVETLPPNCLTPITASLTSTRDSCTQHDTQPQTDSDALQKAPDQNPAGCLISIRTKVTAHIRLL